PLALRGRPRGARRAVRRHRPPSRFLLRAARRALRLTEPFSGISALSEKTVSADSGSTLRTLANLWPYMWPADRADLKLRVVWASVFLVIAKLVLVLVPYFFKWATDALTGELAVPAYVPAILAAPVMLVLAYNVVR